MVASVTVLKKTSPNGKLTVYLGKRDFVDQGTHVDPIEGVVVADPDYLKGRKVFSQVKSSSSSASFNIQFNKFKSHFISYVSRSSSPFVMVANRMK